MASYVFECSHCYAEVKALAHELEVVAKLKDDEFHYMTCPYCYKHTAFDAALLERFEVPDA